jgi:DNA polymerase III subunit epsilon
MVGPADSDVMLSTVQHPTLQHPTLQHPTLQHGTVQHGSVQHGSVQHGTAYGAVGDGSGAGVLDNVDVVVVDVETTGFLPDKATIIEIGAVRLRGAQVTGEFFSLVRPPAPIPPDITELTGITDEMVSRAPSPEAALSAFLAFARGCILAAHHAPFDMSFLASGCRSAGIDWPAAAVLDTAVLARLLLGNDEVPDCKLATLARFFAVQVTPCHRALADAQATAQVLGALLNRVAAGRPGREEAREQGPLYATAAAGARVPG